MCPRPCCRVAALPAVVMTPAPVNKAMSPPSAARDTAIVDSLVGRARRAQRRFEAEGSQDRYDKAAKAAAWALLEPGRNQALSELAVRTTGLGNVADKVAKNHRKTLGLMRDLANARTWGIVASHEASGITEIARPVGIVGAVVPSTNPVATPANNTINALKCGNAIVLSPSPGGLEACRLLLEYVHQELVRVGIDPDLVQMIPAPANKARTGRLLESVDLALATGSPDNVRRAYTSGTPAIGVGTGNVPVIVDETADAEAAARLIARSKTFDNATSCSAENALVVVDALYDTFLAALRNEGCAIVDSTKERHVVERLWPGGRLNPQAIARDARVLIDVLELTDEVPDDTRFIAVETANAGPGHLISGEKISLVVALYRARDFADARAIVARVLDHAGAGHSVGLHTSCDERAIELGRVLPVCRIIVNQAHAIATGGSFDNGLPFSLSMGCGSWGGNSIDENLHWKHFFNVTRVVRTIPPVEPCLEDLFADYWAVCGR